MNAYDEGVQQLLQVLRSRGWIPDKPDTPLENDLIDLLIKHGIIIPDDESDAAKKKEE